MRIIDKNARTRYVEKSRLTAVYFSGLLERKCFYIYAAVSNRLKQLSKLTIGQLYENVITNLEENF